MLVIDGHLDLAMNANYLNRDLTRSVHQLREDEATIEHKHSGYGRGTVALPDLRRGNGVIGAVPALRRQIEGNRKTRLAARQVGPV